ncbi:hypothetical protein SJAG_06620 [Schizosaccharomyces japonicus yFS275]|uniref:Uncharacterized protein n=1 Tax=Schizosaccharomyces japonicus (strain yFS275 / FY16936) TaxID=402676 RepID=T0RSS1_SCHJY|nr:hypothetical protein SJAG_06620 [Schizosaccharomyces japonicus yFS275]EQC52975.1 hypothetical protein SJAG_06620 [Schizosaccharomyces japonicus yFS275]
MVSQSCQHPVPNFRGAGLLSPCCGTMPPNINDNINPRCYTHRLIGLVQRRLPPTSSTSFLLPSVISRVFHFLVIVPPSSLGSKTFRSPVVTKSAGSRQKRETPVRLDGIPENFTQFTGFRHCL